MDSLIDTLFSALWGIEYLFMQKVAKETPGEDKYGFITSGVTMKKAEIEIDKPRLEKLAEIAKSRGVIITRSSEDKLSRHISEGKELVKISDLPVTHRGMFLLMDAGKKEDIDEDKYRSYSYNELRQLIDEAPIANFNIDFLHTRLKEKCEDHFVSGKYDDTIFNACKVVEVMTREKAQLDDTDIGKDLMRKAFNPQSPKLVYSQNNAEQESIKELFANFIGTFKNPHSHRFVDIKDSQTAYEILIIANRLCNILDEIN